MLGRGGVISIHRRDACAASTSLILGFFILGIVSASSFPFYRFRAILLSSRGAMTWMYDWA